MNYFPRKDERQDRCFVVVNAPGQRNADAAKVAALRRAGYPLAVLHLSGEPVLPRYMQLIHYAVFGLGYLRNMNFVTQPGVELYKKIAERHSPAGEKSGRHRAHRRVAGADERPPPPQVARRAGGELRAADRAWADPPRSSSIWSTATPPPFTPLRSRN